MTKVLVIEDEDALRETMAKALRLEGFEVVEEADGRSGMERAIAENPDVILVDILLPGLEGTNVVATLRSRAQTRLTPIIIVTALSQRHDQRRLMELGADDYIVKPFTLEELIGATKAQVRKGRWLRENQEFKSSATGWPYRLHRRRYDPGRRLLRLPGRRSHIMAANEALLFEYMLKHPGRPLSRDELFSAIGRPASSPFDRTIDLLISQLRRKVEDDPQDPQIIRSLRGVGYILLGPVHSDFE